MDVTHTSTLESVKVHTMVITPLRVNFNACIIYCMVTSSSRRKLIIKDAMYWRCILPTKSFHKGGRGSSGITRGTC
jgi:hypothetical protein